MQAPHGAPGWVDLTVDDADSIRDFYASVLPWNPVDTDMGEYADYTMCTPDGEARAGVCHRRGANSQMPPQWMIYFVVEDLDAALAKVREGGGEVHEQRGSGPGSFAVIRDPAGAVSGLYQAAEEG
jgi:predicted enzyme related to lactoylglutathione lyase